MSRVLYFSLFFLFFFVSIYPEGKKESKEVYPVIVLGGGVGSLTSSLYLARAGIAPLVIEGKQRGGLIAQSHKVQNWPGFREIAGWDLAEQIRKQAVDNGVVFLQEEAVEVDFSSRPFTVRTRNISTGEVHSFYSYSCIIAMGTTPNTLGVKGENDYWGKGVTNCAVCDGALYQNEVVVVVGGGDAALLEADYLSSLAKKVFILVRKDSFKGVEEERKKELLSKPNIEVYFSTEIESIEGDGKKVTHLKLKNKKAPLPVDGVFLAIGSQPNTKIFQSQLPLDKKGYVVLGKDQQTLVEGVYAVGDIVDPVYKQAVSAAGDGAKAAIQAEHYLKRFSLDEKSRKLAHKIHSSEPVR